MEDGYKFKEEDMPQVILEVALDALALIQAAMHVTINSLDIPKERKEKSLWDIHSITAGIKDKHLQDLYAKFGKTPDV